MFDELWQVQPVEVISKNLRFAYRNLLVFDVTVLEVFCSFTYKLLKFELKIKLDTGWGRPPGWGSPNPKPNIEKLSFTCEREHGDKKDFSTTWDLATGKWAQPWLTRDSVDPSLRSVLSGLLFGKSKVSPAGSLETEYPFLPWKRKE